MAHDQLADPVPVADPGGPAAGPPVSVLDLAVVVVSYRSRDFLRACLRSLPAATAGLRSRTYVVDNASPDGSAAMVAREFPDAHLTVNRANVGFARANNIALRDAAARHVLLLNPDTEPEPESLRRLVAFMDAHGPVGACGPKLLDTDGSLQPNGSRFPTLLADVLYLTGLRHLMPRRYRALVWARDDFDALSEVDWVSGACLLVRTETLRQVGPMDERFFMFYEDVEWCRRIRSAGWTICYVPEARVLHHWMGTAKQGDTGAAARLVAKRSRDYRESRLLYFQKTSGPLTVLAVRGVTALDWMRRAVFHVSRRARSVLAGRRGSAPRAQRSRHSRPSP